MIEVLIREREHVEHCRIPLQGSTLAGVVPQVLGCLPDRPDMSDTEPVRVPYPVVMALGTPHEEAARAVMNWPQWPEPLACLEAGIHYEFMVVTTREPQVWLRHWISGDRGWLELDLEPDEVRLAPRTRDDIGRALTRDLVALWEAGGSDGW